MLVLTEGPPALDAATLRLYFALAHAPDSLLELRMSLPEDSRRIVIARPRTVARSQVPLARTGAPEARIPGTQTWAGGADDRVTVAGPAVRPLGGLCARGEVDRGLGGCAGRPGTAQRTGEAVR